MGRYIWNPYDNEHDTAAAEFEAEQNYLIAVENDRLNDEASEVHDAQ